MFSEVTYGMVILVDRLVYEVMDMINRHARITFKQEGSNRSPHVTSLHGFKLYAFTLSALNAYSRMS